MDSHATKAGNILDSGYSSKASPSKSSKRTRSKFWNPRPGMKQWATIVLVFVALVFVVSGVSQLVVTKDLYPTTTTTITSTVYPRGIPGERVIKEPDGEPLLLPSRKESVAAAVESFQEFQSASDRCHHPLSAQQVAAYKEYAKKYENVTTLLLTARDGVGRLTSRIAPGRREITIVTQSTVDRLRHLEIMAAIWGGSICAAVHVPARANLASVYRTVKALHERIEAEGYCKLNIQLVTEKGFHSEDDAIAASYPVNALRNVALRMAKTDLVFLLDVDFIPSPGLHEQLTEDESVYADLKSRTRLLRQLLVVPAFERAKDVYNDQMFADDLPMPLSMNELRVRYANGSVDSFRHGFQPAHGPTSYGHFLHPRTKDPYFVSYKDRYEPYVIADRTIIPRYDERFRGYGRNKVSHLYHCSVLGMSFVVLPETFVWGMDHPRSKSFLDFKKQTSQYFECKDGVMKSLYELFKIELHTMPFPAE